MNPNDNPAQVAPVTPGIGVNYASVPEPAPAPVEPVAAPVAEPIAPAPTEPINPTPVEPVAPVTDPTAPVPQQNPIAPAVPVETTPQLSYDEYLESLTKDIKPVELPKPSDVAQDDPDALGKFFEDYSNKVVEKARQEMQRDTIVQNAERAAWGDVFTKYPEIQSNPQLRDTIHNIRMGAYSRGESLSPIQAADALVGTLHAEYKKGINDTNVQTRVQDSQPLNGGGQPQQAPAINYEALQDGGRDAAVLQIQAMMNAGKI